MLTAKIMACVSLASLTAMGGVILAMVFVQAFRGLLARL